MYQAAAHDELTGLADRHQLHLALPELARCASDAAPLSLLLLKIKDFAIWQERLTPLAADTLLAQVGELIERGTPQNALAGRWDHGTFALLLPDCQLWQAEELGEQLAQEWRTQPLLPAFDQLAMDTRLLSGAAAANSANALRLPEAAERQLIRVEGGVFAPLRRAVRPDEQPGLTQAHEAYVYLVTRYLIHGDAYLQRHGEMTAGYAVSVGRRLGLGDAALAELKLAAAFADVAMVEAAGSALHKPGCLTTGELSRIRRHPLFAGDIATEVGLSAGVINTVRCHHERRDGNGYPFGLRGAEIPLSASILGCCGAYAAMLLPRPYRPARKLYSIRAELASSSGGYWPHEVVREVIALT